MAAEQQDVETLKRRGRRRLIGAVALVLLAVIVLPMVFDPEPPRPPAPTASVRIPPEDAAPFTPKAPETKPAAEKKAEKRAEKKAEKKAADKKLADQYVIPVGAFANTASVTAKLESAKVPYFTEPLKGNLTRVRAGPFATREAAEKALEQLKALGFQPGTVSKSG
jgi:DedD protein